MIYWDPNPDLFIIPVLDWPIKWYGLLFAVGFAVGFVIFEKILFRYFLQKNGDDGTFKQKALNVTDQITVYAVIGTVLGARIGHFLFYERPSEYISHPFAIFEVWKGGLSSHGAAIGIVLALVLFSKWSKKIDSGLTWVRLLDFICVPTALAGAFIRIGNFINQEILGTETSLPWGVVFGHPADGSFPASRHPVQLYEALFYLSVFWILWRLTLKPTFLLFQGRLIGLFLILVFGFRVFIEYFKLEQTRLFSSTAHAWTMGQWLSIPLIIAGVLFIFYSQKQNPH